MAKRCVTINKHEAAVASEVAIPVVCLNYMVR